MPKRLIFLRVGISVSYQMVFICLNTAWMSQQTMWKCSLSDLRRVIHTPVSNTCLSREQLFNSSSKKNPKTFNSSYFRKSEEEKGAGLVLCDFLCTQKNLIISLWLKRTQQKTATRAGNVIAGRVRMSLMGFFRIKIKKKNTFKNSSKL